MKSFETKYGMIKGIEKYTLYADGSLRDCCCTEEIRLVTPYGLCTPHYEIREARHKERCSISFYPSGILKSVYLQEPAMLRTPMGNNKAEFVTFYEDESICRIFPLYGQISGFWSEEEEMELLYKTNKSINGITFDHKITCFCFYPSGNVRSLTLATGEKIMISLGDRKIKARIGISFYETGEVKSLEPYEPAAVDTSAGILLAYDNTAVGIHGDDNSLQFTKEGLVKSLKTIFSGLSIVKENETIEILPQKRRSLLDPDRFETVPIKISFENGEINVFDSNHELIVLEKGSCRIQSIVSLANQSENTCTNCQKCNGCN